MGGVTDAGTSAVAVASCQNTGAMPSSTWDWITQQILWQSTLHRTSFFMAVSVLLRTLSRNFALHMVKVDSTFDR